MSKMEKTDPVITERDRDRTVSQHPSFGIVSLSVTQTNGTHLYGSDLNHQSYMRFVVSLGEEQRGSESDSHDPILVQLNDFGRGRGRITISESGSSWTSMWGAMGGSLVNFIQRINNHYWIGYLDKNLTAHIDDDDEANYNFAKKQIIKLRKEKEITAEKARDFYHRLEIEGDVKENYSLCVELFGDDPYYVGWPQIENPEYTFMESRLNAVRRALNTMPKFDTLEDCRIDFEMQHAKEVGLYLEHIGYRYESMETEKAFNAWCKAKGFTFIE